MTDHDPKLLTGAVLVLGLASGCARTYDDAVKDVCAAVADCEIDDVLDCEDDLNELQGIGCDDEIKALLECYIDGFDSTCDDDAIEDDCAIEQSVSDTCIRDSRE